MIHENIYFLFRYQLPIYYDTKNDDIYRSVPRIDDDQPKPNNNNWLYPYISQTRQSVQQIWNDKKVDL
jgi:hypothetical protein